MPAANLEPGAGLSTLAPEPLRYDSHDGPDRFEVSGIVPTLVIDEWSVNGRLGGGGVFGTVVGSGATATYTAPDNAPTPPTERSTPPATACSFAGSRRASRPRSG